METLVKAIHTQKFSIELFEINSKYVIKTTTTSATNYSSMMQDFHLASYIFDLALEEMEGQ